LFKPPDVEIVFIPDGYTEEYGISSSLR